MRRWHLLASMPIAWCRRPGSRPPSVTRRCWRSSTIIVGVLLVVPTAYWVQLRLPKLRPVVEFLTLLPLVIPAIVLVFGYIQDLWQLRHPFTRPIPIRRSTDLLPHLQLCDSGRCLTCIGRSIPGSEPYRRQDTHRGGGNAGGVAGAPNSLHRDPSRTSTSPDSAAPSSPSRS